MGVELLLKHGGKVNAAGKQGLAPLHLAARTKNDEVVRVLLESRADITQPDKSGRTAGQYALTNRSSELARALALDDSMQLSDRIALLENIKIKRTQEHVEDDEERSVPKLLRT